MLTASGKAVAISKLRPGDKVIATDVKTGKTGASAVSAVMVHYDTNLFNLKVRSGGRTSVISTTWNHPFWDLSQHKWITAGTLKRGDHLRTPSGGYATALGGWTSRSHDGWMWDLTVPGPHDFYVQAAATAVLVHNCPAATFNVPAKPGVYTIHMNDGTKYVGMSTTSIASRVAASVGPGHALTAAGYGEADIVNVTWMELQPGVTSVTARTVEQTVMEGWKSFGVNLLNRRDPEIYLPGPPLW